MPGFEGEVHSFTCLGDAMRGPASRTSLCSSTEERSSLDFEAAPDGGEDASRDEMRTAKLCRPHSCVSGRAVEVNSVF